MPKILKTKWSLLMSVKTCDKTYYNNSNCSLFSVPYMFEDDVRLPCLTFGRFPATVLYCSCTPSISQTRGTLVDPGLALVTWRDCTGHTASCSPAPTVSGTASIGHSPINPYTLHTTTSCTRSWTSRWRTPR